MQKIFTRASFLGLVLTLGLTNSASASVILDRGLPDSTNVNDGAGNNRSNVSWISGFTAGDYFLVGDDFKFSNDGTVDSITVYEVANSLGVGSDPGSEFNSVTLYYGGVATLDQSTSAYTSQPITYQLGGENYQGSSGNFYDIYALTFSGLNFAVTANTLYGFAVDAVPGPNDAIPGVPNTLALHASNAALSGTPQQGADNLFRYYSAANQGAASFAFAGFCDTDSSDVGPNACGGWDKSSDINVTIQGTLVPEPASLGLMALGIGALLALAQLRRRSPDRA